MFHKLRGRMKVVVIVVVACMAGGLLWAAGEALFRSNSGQQVALTPVATVNGENITQYELYNHFLHNLQTIQQQQGVLPGSSYETVQYQTLQTLIESVVIQQEIAKRKITASDEEIAAELQTLIDLFPSVEDYETQLELAGLSEEVLKRQIAQEIQFRKLKREVLSDVPVEEWEIKEAYEEVRPSHILVSPLELTEEGWAEAEARAWEIYAEVNAENFADLAVKYSEDSSRDAGGDIGFISRGITVPEFEEAAFALGINEISEPVRSQYGYHIIMLTERKDAEGKEFDRVRALIEDEVRDEKGRADLIAWIEGVREEADIVYTDYQMNARAQLLQGNYDEAIRNYKLAIEQQPTNPYLYSSLGDVYQEMDNLDEAIAQYLLAIEQFEEDYSLHMLLGNLYLEAEREDEAVEAYLRASELAPDDIFAQLTLYNNVNRLERYEEARIIEERIAAFQERQAAMLEAQQEATAAEESPEQGPDEPAADE